MHEQLNHVKETKVLFVAAMKGKQDASSQMCRGTAHKEKLFLNTASVNMM